MVLWINGITIRYFYGYRQTGLLTKEGQRRTSTQQKTANDWWQYTWGCKVQAPDNQLTGEEIRAVPETELFPTSGSMSCWLPQWMGPSQPSTSQQLRTAQWEQLWDCHLPLHTVLRHCCRKKQSIKSTPNCKRQQKWQKTVDKNKRNARSWGVQGEAGICCAAASCPAQWESKC